MFVSVASVEPLVELCWVVDIGRTFGANSIALMERSLEAFVIDDWKEASLQWIVVEDLVEASLEESDIAALILHF